MEVGHPIFLKRAQTVKDDWSGEGERDDGKLPLQGKVVVLRGAIGEDVQNNWTPARP